MTKLMGAILQKQKLENSNIQLHIKIITLFSFGSQEELVLSE